MNGITSKQKLLAVWEKFRVKMRSLRSQQLSVLEEFSKKADEEKIKQIRDQLK